MFRPEFRPLFRQKGTNADLQALNNEAEWLRNAVTIEIQTAISFLTHKAKACFTRKRSQVRALLCPPCGAVV